MADKIDYIKDRRGRKRFPITHEKGVRDSNWVRLEEKLKGIEAGKQDTLVPGENIKTIGGQSILGEGNIPVGEANAVKYDSQSLTEAQKAQALANIGGASAESVAAETARATAAEEDIMDAVDGKNAETVTVLPDASASTVGKFYYVGPDGNGEYARYRGIESGGSYSFLPVGTTKMELSTYATNSEVSQLRHEVTADVSQLEAKVTDLDNMLDYSADEEVVTTTADKSYYINYMVGTQIASNSNRSTDYVDVSGYRGKTVKYLQNVYTDNSGVVGMAFYDSNKDFVSGVPCHFGGSAEGVEETTTIVPNNASYARFTIFAAFANQFYVKAVVYKLERIDEIEQDMEGLAQENDLAQDILEVQIKETTLNPGRYSSAFIRYSTGNAESSSSNKATDYVDVSDYRGGKIKYIQNVYTSGPAQVGMAFYDSSKNYISGIPCNSNGQTEGYEETEAIVPSGAYYARFTIFAEYVSQFYVKAESNVSGAIEELKTHSIQKVYSVESSGDYTTTSPIPVHAGEKVEVSTGSSLFNVLIECDENGNYMGSLIYAKMEKSTPYTYYFKHDTYVIVTYANSSSHYINFYKVGVDEFEEYGRAFDSRAFGINCRRVVVPVNKDAFLFKDALITGLRPRKEYDICVTGLENYSKKAFRINKTGAGNYNATIIVRDNKLNAITSKDISIRVAEPPVEKLANKSNLNVFFIGDSILGGRANLIGKEWRRMLSTNDQTTHINDDGTILLPTLNVCPDKITLIGEHGGAANKYQGIQAIGQILTGKRESATGSAGVTENPFYNPDSTEPDEIGTDGFNKRVDFKWYFEKVMGAGNFPELVYICLGANDTTGTNSYDFSLIGVVTHNLVSVIKKMKAACDEIAGGESGVRFKVFGHQMYPLDYQKPYSYDIHKQNIRRQLLDDSFHFSINYEPVGISGYTDFIDTACRFDWELGYTPVIVSTNTRIEGEHDVSSSSDCFHMSPLGHYNYADVLIDDFLLDEHYD